METRNAEAGEGRSMAEPITTRAGFAERMIQALENYPDPMGENGVAAFQDEWPGAFVVTTNSGHRFRVEVSEMSPVAL